MNEVRQTQTFKGWFAGLRDMRAKVQILRRIERAEQGNLGDVAPIGEGVSEMRIRYGPGYRLYFVQRGAAIVILLCGGDKGSQARDIRTAKQMAKECD
jgi:putative addiction module killer protein